MTASLSQVERFREVEHTQFLKNSFPITVNQCFLKNLKIISMESGDLSSYSTHWQLISRDELGPMNPRELPRDSAFVCHCLPLLVRLRYAAAMAICNRVLVRSARTV